MNTPATAAHVSNMARDYPGFFHDFDTPASRYDTRVSDYMANIRLFPDVLVGDPIVNTNPPKGSNQFLPIRNAGSLQRAGEVMAIWCGPQALYSDLAGYDNVEDGPVAYDLDDGEIQWGPGNYGLCYPLPPGDNHNPAFYYNPVLIGNPVNLGSSSAEAIGPSPDSTLRVRNKWMNVLNADSNANVPFNTLQTCVMRFRHNNNTTANMMFADGHVESRLLGTATAKDVSVNYVQPGLGPVQ